MTDTPMSGPMLDLMAQVKAMQIEIERLKVVETRAFKACEVYRDTDQAIPDLTQTVIQFDQEVLDRGGFHDNAVNNTRLTVPAEQGGIYAIALYVVYTSDPSGRRVTSIRINGGSTIADDVRTATGAIYTSVSIGAVRQLAAGDFVEAVVYQDCGTTLYVEAISLITPYFSIARLD